jgi:hypothetical protein
MVLVESRIGHLKNITSLSYAGFLNVGMFHYTRFFKNKNKTALLPSTIDLIRKDFSFGKISSSWW